MIAACIAAQNSCHGSSTFATRALSGQVQGSSDARGFQHAILGHDAPLPLMLPSLCVRPKMQVRSPLPAPIASHNRATVYDRGLI